MRRFAVLAFMVLAVSVPAAVGAQEAEPQEMETREVPYPLEDDSWKQRRFHVSGFGGRISGGTNVGFSENLFFQVGFEQGSDTAYGARVGWAFAARFEVEAEFGSASPGLNAVLTDLSGQGRTVAPFSDLDLTWITTSVNYAVVPRSSRITPILTLGVGTLSVSSSDEPGIDTTEPMLIYGAGLRVRVMDPIALRVDARGLRSGLGGKQSDPTRPAVLVGEFNGTNLLWTVGLDFRF